ncbi:DUF1272 domain-containing protein [Algiphilus sp.]|uniref:DUF1272 domain-containing protein n=1 Tax=Algiphilus sp. TaxID=1872431 RepID=UPI003B52FBCC
MKSTCQQCAQALGWQDPARICSFECTFCPECAQALHDRCPNCAGELVPRPRRTRRPTAVAVSLLRRRLGFGRASRDHSAPTSDG